MRGDGGVDLIEDTLELFGLLVDARVPHASRRLRPGLGRKRFDPLDPRLPDDDKRLPGGDLSDAVRRRGAYEHRQASRGKDPPHGEKGSWTGVSGETGRRSS
jgi:hypothetical protein